MSPAVQHLIETFDHLPETDKKSAASEILRRSVELDLPPLADQDLVAAAEMVFLGLDREEERAS
ncbi:MAG TPA: hypothetical protein VGG06_06615 [Thermoanaerobaculia bacterium]|jgi:hypothetical protein